MNPIIETLASHGIMGVLCVILMLVIRDRQSKLEKEHEDRLRDKDDATRALLALSDKVHSALDKMSDVLELVRHQPAQPYQASQTTGQK